MARYIDLDALLEQINDDCKYAKATNDYQRGCNEVVDWCVKIIKNIPTADVVPRSEVARLEAQIRRLKAYDEERDIALHQRLVREAKRQGKIELIEQLESDGFLNVETWGIEEFKKKYIGE